MSRYTKFLKLMKVYFVLVVLTGDDGVVAISHVYNTPQKKSKLVVLDLR